MKRVIACLLVLAVVLTAPPPVAAAPTGPGGLPADLGFLLTPNGAMPWKTVKQAPTGSKSTKVADLGKEFKSIENTENYADYTAEVDDKFSKIESGLEDYVDKLGKISTTMGLPTEAGDFDPGFKPLKQTTTFFEIAVAIGAQIGTMMSYLRALHVGDLNSSGTFFGFLFIALAWIIIIMVIKVALAVLSDLFNVFWKLWEAIPFLN